MCRYCKAGVKRWLRCYKCGRMASPAPGPEVPYEYRSMPFTCMDCNPLSTWNQMHPQGTKDIMFSEEVTTNRKRLLVVKQR